MIMKKCKLMLAVASLALAIPALASAQTVSTLPPTDGVFAVVGTAETQIIPPAGKRRLVYQVSGGSFRARRGVGGAAYVPVVPAATEQAVGGASFLISSPGLQVNMVMIVEIQPAGLTVEGSAAGAVLVYWFLE